MIDDSIEDSVEVDVVSDLSQSDRKQLTPTSTQQVNLHVFPETKTFYINYTGCDDETWALGGEPEFVMGRTEIQLCVQIYVVFHQQGTDTLESERI